MARTREVRVTLIGKPGCHLCDDARAVVGEVVEEVRAGRRAPSITVEERSIEDDAGLAAKYAEEIPVVLVDGRMHAYWRVDPERLRKALTGRPTW
ncbi:glutaredoxin family protein [Agromyces archimandritae]|uniref:Glutaredoxin family protein n=1 Tax=Agromyces archimandritae TaxID=2781962 RepID=A0A975FKJ1_9MICO|nr:glutaredoxin family protein [Agromyces archimandritae]QTX03612.1 glutaredoxin family protein [Agromyces archimandritae]